ncbi:division/cell wall cluster transcriptional repressor MraZ [Sphingomonas cavernae]|uniref:SpoVT-AbrB domain-containing protein n=1 Tax=Sphingomonas cavernae TaxID=2320861 RepID=A0A418WKE4_9SPHN|nr:hypothetical protein [Sphingomonas cavernae]RJF90521.1 hypothetical protein D3876_09830 [Sphingomonas cavernae]
MNTRRTYRGFGLSGIDGKGRVAIPAKLRATLEVNSNNERVIALSRSRTSPCLTGYDLPFADMLPDVLAQEMTEQEGGAKLSRENLNRMAFGVVEDVPYDASGRLVIPPFMRKLGQLEDLAFFHGSGHIIEIWNPHVLLKADDVPPMLVELVQFLLEEKGMK